MQSSNSVFKSIPENLGGGRVGLLLLLFVLALYMFYSAGFPAFAIVCASPLLVLGVFLCFRYRMMVFWMLTVINYLIQWKNFPSTGIPMSLYNEAFELLLISLAIIRVEDARFEKLFNPMGFALAIWSTFSVIELLNDTCGLGFNFGLWYTGARLMTFQLVYAFVVFSLYITTPKVLMQYLIIWALLSLFAALWVWKQKYFGLTDAERSFLYGQGRVTHIIAGGTIIRLFSIFSDAANYGINMAVSSVAFLAIGITSKILRYKLLFLTVGVTCMLAMGPSGTRSATMCFLAGVGAYVFLSKSFKIAVPVAIVLGLMYFFLAFTNIGNGNSEIRRMRSAFDKNDASMGARYTNQAVMKKYLSEAPWGIGIGTNHGDVPPNNKFYRLSTMPPDSEYVYIWVHTGVIGITTFLIVNGIILFGACYIIFFRLKNRTLQGIASGLTSSFISYHLGGYANQVMMQFPNCLLFYGAITIVYTLPGIESQWTEYEAKLLKTKRKETAERTEKLREQSVVN